MAAAEIRPEAPRASAFPDLAAEIHALLVEGGFARPKVVWATRRGPARPPPRPAALTARELEVLKCIADGDTTKETAARLRVGVKTVETHRRNLMGKLGIDSVALLTKYAVREEITTLEG